MRADWAVWMLCKLTDSLYSPMVGVSSKCFGSVEYEIDGISGVILIWPIEPVMAKMSVSLAGRNGKYGTLRTLRSRLFSGDAPLASAAAAGALMLLLLTCGRRMTSAPSVSSSSRMDANALLLASDDDADDVSAMGMGRNVVV